MGDSATAVSVIVPARNARGTVGVCVRALLEQVSAGLDVELIVVDDGSTDETARAARVAGAKVLSIPPSGVAAARNRGVEQSRGDILVFTDADCIADPGWLAKMTAPFVDPEVTASKGVYRSEQTSLTARFVQHEYESRYQRMRRRESIDFIDTYAAAYRREQFFRAGGFDEDFVIGEDQEFSFRYLRQGGRAVFVEDAVVKHFHVDSTWRYFRKKQRIAWWKMRVVRRHPDKVLGDSHTPATVKIEMASALAVLLTLPFVFSPWALTALAAAVFVFASSVLPLVVTIARRDPSLGAVSPALLFARALALCSGCIGGIWGARGWSRVSLSASSGWLRLDGAEERRAAAQASGKDEVYEVT